MFCTRDPHSNYLLRKFHTDGKFCRTFKKQLIVKNLLRNVKYTRHLIFKVDFLHMNASKLACFLVRFLLVML